MLLDKIIRDLGDNYDINDNQVLLEIIDEITYSALSITNREDNEKNRKLLEPNIKKAVIAKYLQRGAENTTSYSELGKSVSYQNYMEVMTQDLIMEGKRVIC